MPAQAIATKSFGLAEVGNTPLVDLSYLSPNEKVKIYGKAEFSE